MSAVSADPTASGSGRAAGVFGLVASDPTVSRLIATLAGDVDAALGAIASARAVARAVARARVWGRPGAPVADGRVVIDLDATVVIAHSEKEFATRTWKKTFGFHPLLAYADHGDGGTGEPLSGPVIEPRDGAAVAEAIGLVDLSAWPVGPG